MSNRMHATPMDFQYENGTGPLDERSPFAQVGRNSQRNNAGSINDKKREFSFLLACDPKPKAHLQRWLMGSSNRQLRSIRITKQVDISQSSRTSLSTTLFFVAQTSACSATVYEKQPLVLYSEETGR
jgi:hypothetical protein